VPIEGAAGPAGGKKMHKLVPIEGAAGPAGGKKMHKLIPINNPAGPTGPTGAGSKKMHNLVPIGNKNGSKKDKHHKRHYSIESAIAQEDLETDVFGLPTLTSYLPKRRN
jgi:hypothetical protein